MSSVELCRYKHPLRSACKQYSVSKKTGPLQLISYNFTNTQHSLIFLAQTYLIQFSIDCDKEFLNWLRTSCVVSITPAEILHIWTADFCADFEQRIIDRAINEWQNDCGVVSMPKGSIRTRVVSFDSAKHFVTVCLKDLTFLLCGNDAQLRIAMVTRFSWYFAANTTVF